MRRRRFIQGVAALVAAPLAWLGRPAAAEIGPLRVVSPDEVFRGFRVVCYKAESIRMWKKIPRMSEAFEPPTEDNLLIRKLEGLDVPRFDGVVIDPQDVAKVGPSPAAATVQWLLDDD